MNCVVILSVLCLLIVESLGMTTTTHKHHVRRTHPTHATVERPVVESFTFRYDPKSHLMAAITRHKCYIYSMSSQETTDVHMTHGLRTLETKLINMVDDTTQTYPTMTIAQLNATSHALANVCQHYKNVMVYKLN